MERSPTHTLTDTHTHTYVSDYMSAAIVLLPVEIAASFIVPLQCQGDIELSQLQRQREKMGESDLGVRQKGRFKGIKIKVKVVFFMSEVKLFA